MRYSDAPPAKELRQYCINVNFYPSSLEMSNHLQNSTVQTKIMADPNTTNAVTVTSLLHEIARITTEMTKIVMNGTTESYTEVPLTTSRTTTQATWNFTKSAVATTTTTTSTIPTTSNVVTTTNKTCSTTTTAEPFDEFGPPEGVEYIFVPLGVMIFVIVLSAVVLIVSRRRKLERLRHRLMPLYNFDPGEEGEDDWETELLDEGFGSRQRRQGYQSMDSEENAELFGPSH